MKRIIFVSAMVLCLVSNGIGDEQGVVQKPPFSYVFGKAYYILPETTSDESGYFSLCEGKNGKIYIGTAKYGQNSYLVEFDPVTEKQRIVIDTHKVCGLTATGYAAQAKIHTRNFVAPSGKIYVGSKQGYRRGTNDTAEYPGGYVMVYDPTDDKAHNLGMPYKGLGVIDVAADEVRKLLYVVTCEDEHWMLGDIEGKSYEKMGPMLIDYATTLIDSNGNAHAITADFNLASYNPQTKDVKIRKIVDPEGKSLFIQGSAGIPNWILTPDGKTAYLIRLGNADVFAIDLSFAGETITAQKLCTIIKGENPDSRGALAYGPDGKIYALVKIKNDTGYGTGSLHKLGRYDVKTGKTEELGVIAIKNKDFFDFEKAKNEGKKWIHGYHTLPDGTLTPLHCHMAMIAASDGTLYITILYPFTLLRIDKIAAGR